jgi:hypothetical protein
VCVSNTLIGGQSATTVPYKRAANKAGGNNFGIGIENLLVFFLGGDSDGMVGVGSTAPHLERHGKRHSEL